MRGKLILMAIVFVIVFVVFFGIGVAFATEMPDSPVLWVIIVGALVLFVAYILWNLKGTRGSVTEMSDAERKEALKFEPVADMASLYIVRSGFVGKAAGLNITIDKQDICQLKSPRFTRVLLSPGKHQLIAKFGGGAGVQSKPVQSDISCKAGQILFARIVIEMGMTKNTISIEPMEPDEAHKAISKAKAIKPAVESL